ncbi:IclR family transcriptional regulator [Intrasporangium sp.]|uniref:IclR family transcriptional regulator n=1 Tax=Intrasporangium sp. TaxID=1925024 RepID=UPI00293A6774|nr:IclR family transcriptional regulator [Intrasporangium sp.]MDV3221157.1 IclR family transcriptional regulator [Intrasporangium sp.]
MDTAKDARPGNGTTLTAAQRVLAILDVFDDAHTMLTLSEISRRSGLTLTTTHRLVGELHAWGALSRDPRGRYSVGLRILELGVLAPGGLQLREVAQPFLNDLHHVTRANVHLAVREGHDVVYLESLRAPDGVPVLSRLGGRWPLHATGTGQVLLAYAGPDVREEVLSSPLKRFSRHTIVEPAQLRSVLSEVRWLGYAVAASQLTEDAVAVAAPIRGPEDDVIAAVGVTVRCGTVSPQAMAPALMAASRGISRALGAPSANAPRPEHAGPRTRRSGHDMAARAVPRATGHLSRSSA